MDGYAFTRLLRDCHHTLPIVMLSSWHQIEDVKKGFIAGTDDYLGKPFDEEELLLRIHALLRRARLVSDHILRYGSTELNYDTLTVRIGDEATVLPQKEFYLLYKLLSYPDQIFTRTQLMEEIWGPSSNSLDATVSVHINRLRKRFASCPDFSIVTIHGVGYTARIRQNIPVIPRPRF
jgi:DNA-binding response OmpR family regulator